ncbi:MAG: DNA mismatch repair endonuclease MutL [Clostridia bacterium]|nr:DNA mismatch repair endonuclease MutL [Clostridia bacterium]
MGIINTLDTQTSNMIAAGEVVDRPASALKELIENSIDAGATKITAEIKGGGILMMRVTDNGVGISREDMPKTILRHATSKIKTASDLDGVLTLGFRGEALAALSSVAKTEIISKHIEADEGYRLYCDENGVELDEHPSPRGTAITARELFYNQPARRKFLKKDVSETAACVPVVEKLALAHPEISFTLITDGEKRFVTSGDGDLYNTIYALYGKETAKTFIPAEYESDKVKVYGYVSSPEYPRGSRRGQVFLLNGRCVQNKTMQAALERGFESYIPRGKYPACVLNIQIDPLSVDVNVHPAKLEVKFADERKIFESVYCCVRNAFSLNVTEEDIFVQTEAPSPAPVFNTRSVAKQPLTHAGVIKATPFRYETQQETREYTPFTPEAVTEEQSAAAYVASPVQEIIEDTAPSFTYVGELWNTYVAVTTEDSFILFDKHAVHERIVYEQIRNSRKNYSQELLTGVPVTLNSEEFAAALENRSLFEQYGYSFEEFGADTLLIRAVPSALFGTKQETGLFTELCAAAAEGTAVPLTERCEKAVYTAACKAAVRAKEHTTREENEELAKQLLSRPEIRYCPHGRPVMHIYEKREINKFFDR